MIDHTILFEYLRQCPYLADMFSIAAEMEQGNKVILPQGASPRYNYVEKIDILGNYDGIREPYPSIYEDFQINCYVYYDTKDNNPPKYNSNVLTLEEVGEVCKWIEEQDRAKNFPDIGKKVISIECNPFVPQYTGYVDEATNTAEYFVTVRVRYVNTADKERIYIERED